MAAESYIWIDSAATSHAMDGSTGVEVLAGPIGLYMPPLSLLDQRTPGQPGTTIKYTDILPRPITLPIHIQGATESALETLKNALVETWFANPGTLRRTRPDGSTQRDLACSYLAGLGLDESDTSSQTRGSGWIETPLQLLAAVPFWTDTADTTAGPYSNTQMGAGQTIANNGTWECYAKWTLHGPFSAMVITNTTTGYKMDLTANGGLTLGNTDSLVIDTTAGTMLLNGSTDERSHLSYDSILFPLAKGNNAITWSYSSGLNGTTTTTLTFRQRSRTP